ncbi:MAG: rhomboid family intramembrane serine protease [Planctomycetota bacterium]|nr:rhomboid family intramembrane serine protease [Planctomycetota bacterium]
MAKGLQGIVWFVAVLWVVYLADAILPSDFNQYGLVPRTLHGLLGIPLMPFLHGSFQHLLSNTVPLCILLFILHGSRGDSLEVIVSIVLFGGLLLWCFGRSRIHIGASGLVYGLVAFLITVGFAERKFVSLFIALVVGFLYGTTLLFGVLPTAGWAISWEGHLFGAIAGACTAIVLANKPGPEETMDRESKADE